VAIIRKPELGKPEQQRLFDALHVLHLGAGAPSIRALQERIGTLSRDTVHRVLAGPAVPAWPAVEAVVQALHGDVDRFRVLWMAAQRPPTPDKPVIPPDTVELVDEPIKVLVVEDHPLYRSALTRLLGEAGCVVVGEAANGASGVDLAVELLPDVVLMDLKMPKMDGFEATKEIIRARPTVRVLVVTAHAGPDVARKALAAGATGFLTKDAAPNEILAALQAVHHGHSHIDPRLLSHPDLSISRDPTNPESQRPVGLSVREREILRLVAEGTSDVQISERLGVSIRTVRSYLDRIRDKTGRRRRPELTRFAVEEGLFTEHVSAEDQP
jgi:DNA-binding NarL/FixJ family response regulator